MPAFSEQTIADALRDRAAAGEGLRVVEVHVRDGQDSDGNPAYFVELVLPNPPREAGTWPVERIWELRRWVRDAISDIGDDDDVRWFVAFEQQGEDELNPEDAADRIAAG